MHAHTSTASLSDYLLSAHCAPDLHALSGACRPLRKGPCPGTDWINYAKEPSPKYRHGYEDTPHSSAIRPASEPSCAPD